MSKLLRPGEPALTDKLTPWDKLLPDQPRNNEHYEGAPEAYYRRLLEVVTKASGLTAPGREFDVAQSDLFSIEEMASNPISLRFLEMLVRLTGAREVLEIGAFIGLSAIHMARALPEGGRVVTLEKFSRFADVARQNFVRSGLGDRIVLMEGSAADLLPTLAGRRFDLVFLDGHKERYADYFQMLDPLVRPGGLLVVDDALYHGDVLNDPPRTEKGQGVSAFLEAAGGAEGYLRVLLPVANGTMLMLKNPEAGSPR